MIENFGKNVRRLRKEYHMTASDLAECLGTSETTIYNIERGRTHPTFLNLEKISRIFHAEPLDLFCTAEERKDYDEYRKSRRDQSCSGSDASDVKGASGTQEDLQ